MLNFSVTFLITILNITVLFLILKAVLFKPLTKFMTERAQRIQSSIDQAEKDKQTAQQILTRYEDRLKAAEAEAAEIIRNAREQAETEAQIILAESRREAERVADTVRAKLETDRLAAMAIFKAEAAALVVRASGRLLRRELAGAEQQRYAAEALEQILTDTGNV